MPSFNSLSSFLLYVFHPNPGGVTYMSPSMSTLLVVSALLIVASFAIRFWRRRLKNPITKKLSRSWAMAALSFGFVEVVLVASRVEGIQYLAMRFLWVLWVLALAGYAFLQVRLFRSRHYEILPTMRVEDPRDKYLPGKKRR